MFVLFNNYKLDFSPSVKQYPEMRLVGDRYREFLKSTTEYYNTRNFATYNDHVLSKLVYILNNKDCPDLTDFMLYVKKNGTYVARQLGFSTFGSYGFLNKNFLFSTNSKEIYIEQSYYTPAQLLFMKYQDIEPVRYMYTTSTDIDFYMSNGKKPNISNNPIQVIGVDIDALMVKFWHWSIERIKNERSDNTNVFIYTQIFPSMIPFLMDISIFNRMLNIYYGNKLIEFPYKHPFYIPSYVDRIDKILKNVIEQFSNKTRLIPELLMNIPTLFSSSMLETLNFPHTIYNKQTAWTVWLGRIEYIHFILDLLGENGKKRNTIWISKLQHNIREYHNNLSTLDRLGDTDIKIWFETHLKAIKEHIHMDRW